MIVILWLSSLSHSWCVLFEVDDGFGFIYRFYFSECIIDSTCELGLCDRKIIEDGS